MPASFTSMDSESEISADGNPMSTQSGRKPLKPRHHQRERKTVAAFPESTRPGKGPTLLTISFRPRPELDGI
jgi:hypothetical protein